jgi:KaiC/GvpD/RAD55 family RecA-like ATPase
MTDRSSGFASLCRGSSSEKCDLHFLVENEVAAQGRKMDKLEEASKVSFNDLHKTLNDFIVEVRSYIGSQSHKDRSFEEMRTMVNKNTSDINDMRLVLGSMTTISSNLQKLTEAIQIIDKSILTKSDVESITQTALVVEKSKKQDKWFDSLPAKVSAGVAVISFIAFFTIKIVLLLLAASQ